VSFRNSLRHRNSASANVVSTLKSVCLSVSLYRNECWKLLFECLFDTFECDLISALKSVISNTRYDKGSVVFTLKSVVFPLKQTPLSVETTLFLCRTIILNKICEKRKYNDNINNYIQISNQ
jgi:hypothetical protein